MAGPIFAIVMSESDFIYEEHSSTEPQESSVDVDEFHSVEHSSTEPQESSVDVDEFQSAKNSHEPAKPSTSKVFSCYKCNRSFKQSRSLKYHYKVQHPEENFQFNRGRISDPDDVNYSCDLCSRKYKYRKHLVYHKKVVHGVHPCIETPKQKCCLCHLSFTKKQIIPHYETEHDLTLESENLEFSSFADFLSWKEIMERESNSRYRKQTGDHQSRDTVRQYFHCHRSGTYVPTGKGQRHLKTQGSHKINGYCPASLKVVQSGGICKVHYLKTHVGHQNDVRHLELSLLEKNSIAQKLSAKIPFNDILDEIRGSITDSDLKRVHLVTRKDLHNIKNGFTVQESEETEVDPAEHLQQRSVNSLCEFKESRKKVIVEHKIKSGFTVQQSKESAAHPAQLLQQRSINSLYEFKEGMKKDIISLIDSISSTEIADIVNKQILSIRTTIAAVNSGVIKLAVPSKIPASKNTETRRQVCFKKVTHRLVRPSNE